MVRYLKIFILMMLLFSISLESFNGNDIIASSMNPEIFSPINQRLNNSLSNFEQSNYIEKQVNRFMHHNGLNGVSIAIVKDEKLVYSKAYGYSDVENNVEASPENIFRIASISKLITAVSIMQLVEEGQLSLDGKVFGEDGYLHEKSKLWEIKDKRIEDITLRHLLSHTSGFTNRYGDPMFLPHVVAEKTGSDLPLNLDSYLKFAFERSLHFTPGTSSGYSNMGYLFLGAVIEKVSSMEYEQYAKNILLNKIGVFDMHIGRNHIEDKRFNEVKYYEDGEYLMISPYDRKDTLVAKPYGGNDVELLGAAGGWIASAPELAKLLVSIDGFNNVEDILSPESIGIMTDPENKPMGWMETNHDGIWYRTGNFAGSTAIMARRHDGLHWVFLANTSNWKGNMISEEIKRMMNRIVLNVEEWPQKDLFYILQCQ